MEVSSLPCATASREPKTHKTAFKCLALDGEFAYILDDLVAPGTCYFHASIINGIHAAQKSLRGESVIQYKYCSTIGIMTTNVQARLDRESQMALEGLVRRLGWSPSRVVREGIHLLAACYGRPSKAKVIGVGRFASDVRDLGSNKKHLKGFGR